MSILTGDEEVKVNGVIVEVTDRGSGEVVEYDLVEVTDTDWFWE